MFHYYSNRHTKTLKKQRKVTNFEYLMLCLDKNRERLNFYNIRACYWTYHLLLLLVGLQPLTVLPAKQKQMWSVQEENHPETYRIWHMFLASKREKQRRRRKREKSGGNEWWRRTRSWWDSHGNSSVLKRKPWPEVLAILISKSNQIEVQQHRGASM